MSDDGALRLHDQHALLSTVQLPAALATPGCSCRPQLAVLAVKSLEGYVACELKGQYCHQRQWSLPDAAHAAIQARSPLAS